MIAISEAGEILSIAVGRRDVWVKKIELMWWRLSGRLPLWLGVCFVIAFVLCV